MPSGASALPSCSMRICMPGSRMCSANLASEEISSRCGYALLDVQVIQPVFEDWKNGRYKIISFFAKRARGLMACYAAEHRLKDVEALKQFDSDDYAFAPEASSETSWVFRRKLA